uniref:EGF-like domain-containing protein n=1 Tax=Panagrellus redivivus TaxID=6233 RepID=A0A7E4VD08_PANRE
MLLLTALIFISINAAASEGQTGANLVTILKLPSPISSPPPPPATGCPADFTGPKCEIPICNPSNGQLVYRSPDEYFCKCADGIVGKHCETVICQNGGIPRGSIDCDCSGIDFTGRFCHLPSESVKKEENKNYYFTVILIIYSCFIMVFFACVSDSRAKLATVDAPYSASRPESKWYNFYYYAFVSKDVKLF